MKIMRREYGKKWYLIRIPIIVLAFFLRGNEALGLALLIGVMIFDAYFTAVFDRRSGVEDILSGSGYYQRKKDSLHIVRSLLHNLFNGIITFAYICLSQRKVNVLSILYTLVLLVSVNAVTLFLAKYIKQQLVGLLLCTGLTLLNFVKVIILEEYLRYISPVIQIENMNRIQWWNLLVLFFISGGMYMTLLWKKKTFLFIGLFCSMIVAGTDIYLSQYASVLPDTYKNYVVTLLEQVNERNKECGFDGCEQIIVYKSVYYPWEPVSHKVFIYEKEDTLYANCFTESLCNMNEEEIIMRAVLSRLKPDSKMQNIMADLYMQQLLGNNEYVKSFLYEEQTKRYGAVVSKYYGFCAEILINEPERYGELYELSKMYSTPQEIINVWR